MAILLGKDVSILVSFSLSLFFGGCLFLSKEGNCLEVDVPGSVTETNVTQYEFLGRLANPCGIEREELIPNLATGNGTGTAAAVIEISEMFDPTEFYESMLIMADLGLLKIKDLLKADPSLPTCKGIHLDTLPFTPSFKMKNDDLLIKELYNSCLFLAAHLHIMGLDRQLSLTKKTNDVPDSELDEQNNLPHWRILTCGNETNKFMPSLEELTLQMEEMLCFILSSSNLEQRALFREPFNHLTNTTFYRYHSSCSILQIRDCLVIQETKATLTAIVRKFNKLLIEARPSTNMGSGGSSDPSGSNPYVIHY